MKIICFVLLSGLAFQLSVSSLLPAIRTSSTKTLFPPLQNLNNNQRAGCSCSKGLLKNLLCGVVRTVGGKILPKLCCDCTPEPVKKCPEFKCMALHCPNGQRPTFFPTGCRGCDECIPEIKTTTEEPECTTPECITTPEPEIITTPKPECATTQEPEYTTTPEPECTTTLKPSCKKLLCIVPKCLNGIIETVLPNECPGCPVCKQLEIITTPEAEILTTPEPEIITTSEPECITTPEPECTTTPKPQCKKLLCIVPNCPNGTTETILPNKCPGCPVCKQPEIITTPEPEIITTPEPEIITTPEAEILTTPEPEIITTPEPEIITTPEPECTTTPKPQCKKLLCIVPKCPNGTTETILPNKCPGCPVCKQPEIITTPEPEIITTPEPAIITTPEPECITTPEPEIITTPEPEYITTPEPECTTTPKPPCKKLLCIVPKCPNGTTETILPNKCPGCPVCKP